jgi:(1->4)-alpha-D-glucan 1-alpha-D-glucosylmutase
LKLAWTARLLKMRNELAEVFTDGDYQPLEVSGPHRDHIIAFARRRGRNAAIVVAGRWFAPFTQGGRIWPKPDALDATINVRGFAVEGDADAGTEIRVSSLFQQLPAAVLKASVVSAAWPARRKAVA